MAEDLEFIDTHVHFFDFSQPDLRWVWLEPEFVHPIVGNIDGMKSRRYLAEEFEAESRFNNVKRCVHVQAALGTDDPVLESQWLEDMADNHPMGMPQALVADARMQQPDIEEVLERQAANPRVRGIRDFAEGDYLVDPAFERGYAALAKHGWVYDLDATWEDFHKARALAERHPETIMILDHAGFPRERTDEYFANWKNALHDLAKAENVVVKVSGLGMCDQRWTLDSIRPWALECIEAFTPDRTIFGTNWPLDRLYSSYTDVVQAYRTLIAPFSEDEQRKMFSANAERIFKM